MKKKFQTNHYLFKHICDKLNLKFAFLHGNAAITFYTKWKIDLLLVTLSLMRFYGDFKNPQILVSKNKSQF